MYDLIIRDATIIRGTQRLVADIAIEGDKIAYVGGRPGGGAKEDIQAIGRFVLPGVIDTHVHFRDPGHTYKEDWGSGSRAAVTQGVTTVLDMPNTTPPTSTLEAAKAKLEIAANKSMANYGVWAAAISGNIKDLNEMADSGLVCGTKVFLGDTTGSLHIDDDTLHTVFHEGKGLLGVHAEDEEVLTKTRAQHRDVAWPSHNDVRPPEAAAASVAKLIELVRETNRPLHICHLSTADELALLDPLFRGLPITTEVCPHHLFLSVETLGDLGNLGKCNPPIRSELDRRGLWTAIRRGRIDSFASDHAPHTLEEKAQDYWDAPSGIPGVDTTVPLLMSAIKHGKLSLELFVEMCCHAPARIFGLQGKGVIEEGADADLILVSEGETHKLKKSHIKSQCGWSPFVGREVGVPPKLVVVQGKIVAREGELVTDESPAAPVVYQR